METTHFVVQSDPWGPLVGWAFALACPAIVSVLAWRMDRRGLWLVVPWLFVVAFMVLFTTMILAAQRSTPFSLADVLRTFISAIDISSYYAAFFMGLVLAIVGVKASRSTSS